MNLHSGCNVEMANFVQSTQLLYITREDFGSVSAPSTLASKALEGLSGRNILKRSVEATRKFRAPAPVNSQIYRPRTQLPASGPRHRPKALDLDERLL